MHAHMPHPAPSLTRMHMHTHADPKGLKSVRQACARLDTRSLIKFGLILPADAEGLKRGTHVHAGHGAASRD